jgi:hypothetical protein
MIKVEFNGRVATVYNDEGKVINKGRSPQDLAFARNVINTKGYNVEETQDGHKRVVYLRKIVGT